MHGSPIEAVAKKKMFYFLVLSMMVYVMFGRSAYMKRQTVLYNTGSWLNFCAAPDSLYKPRQDGVQPAHSDSATITSVPYKVILRQMAKPFG